jgi:PAS domain S-box-containing protein
VTRTSGRRERSSAARHLRQIIERAPIAIVVHREGRILYANAVCRQYLGIQRVEEVAGTDPLALVPVDERGRFRERLARIQAGGSGGPTQTEFVRADGTTMPIELAGFLLEFDGEPAIATLARDLTSEREMQRQLLIADRMVTIGTLAAGVAHEINNPLAYVHANIEVALERLSRSDQGTAAIDEVRDALVEARHGAARVRLIIRDLNTFARQDDDGPKPIELRPVIESALNVAYNGIRHHAQLVKEYGPVPLVLASAAKLGQVFLNLLVNAAQAIPQGAAERNQIHLSTATDELGRAVVTIRDTGVGMTSEIQRRIFDPFFTTKPTGEGTGLGLTISQRIVSSLGGEIRVESESGKGATFRVVLPRTHGEATPAPLEAPLDPAESRRARILVVDDDPLVQKAVRRVLSAHEVVAEASGRGALDRLAAGERYDVILCDLAMPGMSGMDVHQELTKVDPSSAARMIFLTGGVFTPAAQRFLDRVPNLRVEKPFQAADLRALVRTRLG